MSIESEIYFMSGQALVEPDFSTPDNSPAVVAANESVWNSVVAYWPEQQLTQLMDNVERVLADIQSKANGRFNSVTAFKEGKEMVFAIKGEPLAVVKTTHGIDPSEEISPAKLAVNCNAQYKRAFEILQSGCSTYKDYHRQQVNHFRHSAGIIGSGTKHGHSTFASSDNNSH